MKTRGAVSERRGATADLTGGTRPGVVTRSWPASDPELITKKYTLDEINDGYADLMDGKNIRGVIVSQH